MGNPSAIQLRCIECPKRRRENIRLKCKRFEKQ